MGNPKLSSSLLARRTVYTVDATLHNEIVCVSSYQALEMKQFTKRIIMQLVALILTLILVKEAMTP